MYIYIGLYGSIIFPQKLAISWYPQPGPIPFECRPVGPWLPWHLFMQARCNSGSEMKPLPSSAVSPMIFLGLGGKIGTDWPPDFMWKSMASSRCSPNPLRMEYEWDNWILIGWLWGYYDIPSPKSNMVAWKSSIYRGGPQLETSIYFGK
jgi:hypothetical protein